MTSICSRKALSWLVALTLSGCNTLASVTGGGGPTVGKAGPVEGFAGGAAGDEPRAVLIARQILGQGGSAADAAAALGFALSVTLPSRAGLGAGGACLAYNPAHKSIDGGMPEAVLFTAQAPRASGGDRPAALPMLARGLYALQARYGVLPIEQIVAPAEQMARFGVPVSRSLAQDLAVVAGPLLQNRAAALVFAPQGAALGEGETLIQADLGATLARLRVAGAGDLYQGALATQLLAGAAGAGGALPADELRTARPVLATPLSLPAGRDTVAFLPLPADGGLAAAAAYQRLQVAPDDLDGAQARALGAASWWRPGGHGSGDVAAVLEATAAQPNSIAVLPASTSFVTLDRDGDVVACAISMGNLFGTGRIVAGMGMFLAASPAVVPPPLLAAGIVWNDKLHAFRGAVAGSGQMGAALGVAVGLNKLLGGTIAMPSTVPGPGRVNAIACPRYLPGEAGQCTWATDPRGAGVAVGGG